MCSLHMKSYKQRVIRATSSILLTVIELYVGKNKVGLQRILQNITDITSVLSEVQKEY